MRDDTMETTRDTDDRANRKLTGFIAVFSAGEATFLRVPLAHGRVIVGRAQGDGAAMLPDDRLSRRHAEIIATECGLIVRDLGSRNGTFVDGEPVAEQIVAGTPRVIRVGDTLLVPCDDLEAAAPPTSDAGMIKGARLRAALQAVTYAARSSETLLVRGETGTGKELAARTFHANGPHGNGPLVAVNCAAIPEGLAERLLFGTKRGAYSGAAEDAIGHIAAADGGVLFLDEVGELDLNVQAKLLRALETREVAPLGATAGRRVNVRVCVATHRDLRAQVAAGKFRADLYHRLAPPEVVLPPLRDRLDEIARHVVAEVATRGMTAHARFIEACLLRTWPGNVRELRKEVRHAAARALGEGEMRVRIEHLSDAAGRAFEGDRPTMTGATPPEGVRASDAPKRRSYIRWSQKMTREQIERALSENEGNVAHAAKSLGMHRTQLYREMARFSVAPRARTS